ncbi:MAG: hypothetical protein GTN76_16615 [Candidatus Aenigmarchaeota archaeon]|nr:hypothetical protein [Candidatus Aenigmarchaeota archaeon]
MELERDVLNRTPERLNQVNLVSSPGIEIETEPLRIVSLASVFWRARVTDTKDQQFVRLTMDGDDQSIEKKVVTHPQKKRFSPEKSKWHLWGSLVNHGEDFLPNTSPFLTIKVSYGRGSYPFLFWNTDPIILYFIFTFVFALLLKPIIKVYI